MPSKPGDTVNAVLETLHNMGRVRSNKKNYFADLIAGLDEWNGISRPASITDWCKGRQISPQNLPQLAIRALGLQHYGFGTELWDMAPEDADQALRMSLQNGIMGLLGDNKPVPGREATLVYYTGSQEPCLGIVLADELEASSNLQLPPPTNLLTIHGQEHVLATVPPRVLCDLHIRVLLEDISGGKPEYYQINALLGFEETISRGATYTNGDLYLRHSPEDDCRQTSRIWTFLRSTQFPEPWLPGNAPARKQEDPGTGIDMSKIEAMLGHYRMSPPGQYAMSLTQVNYVAGNLQK